MDRVISIHGLKFCADAVHVEDLGKQASLVLTFKTIDRLGRENSDTIRFISPFGGRTDATEDDAIRDCLTQAWQWAKFERLSGFDVSAWDSSGNYF